MKPRFGLGALALLGLLLAGCATYGRTYYGFSIDYSNVPPPPYVYFDHEPPLVVVPGTSVYFVDGDYGYDLFRWETNWYLCYQGYWYSAPRYGGPYTFVRAHRLPPAIRTLPPEQRWRGHPQRPRQPQPSPPGHDGGERHR